MLLSQAEATLVVLLACLPELWPKVSLRVLLCSGKVM